MKKFLTFAGVLCIGIVCVVPAGAQIAGQKPSVPDPFTIDRGTSFSASTTKTNIERARAKTTTPEADRILSDIEEVMRVIRGKHVDGEKVRASELTKSSVSSMLAELDPHSNYFDASEFSLLLGEQDSEYSGTGSTITNYVRGGKTETYIIATHDGSAAAKADLRYGDRIVAVDGDNVTGLTSEFVRDKVRGPRGTIVRLTIERAATGKVETVELKRDRIFQPTIPNFFIVRDGVGYIDLSEGFSHTTFAEFEAALRELRRRGMTSLLLDLRGNSGGILDQAIKVAEKFLPSGSLIISQRGRTPVDRREWKSTNQQPESLPVVVLVDNQTASASEVVAGALQDNDRALILGQNTFGKGLVQNVVALPAGSGLTLTTARYFTPSGRSIQRTYAGAGLYDYFNHRQANEAAATKIEARTVTNRPVFGGKGIAPDETLDDQAFNNRSVALLDPIFFFVRDLVNRTAMTTADPVSARDRIRQSIIFGKGPGGHSLLSDFRKYLATAPTDWNISSKTLDENAAFIVERLNSELALATFGSAAAKHQRIETEVQITKAIDALPRAATLAAAAQRIRVSNEHKKTRRVAFPTGQGRNRRN